MVSATFDALDFMTRDSSADMWQVILTGAKCHRQKGVEDSEVSRSEGL